MPIASAEKPLPIARRVTALLIASPMTKYRHGKRTKIAIADEQKFRAVLNAPFWGLPQIRPRCQCGWTLIRWHIPDFC
jgi:hypothetical protein